jgi:hypothetical protein
MGCAQSILNPPLFRPRIFKDSVDVIAGANVRRDCREGASTASRSAGDCAVEIEGRTEMLLHRMAR